MSNYNHIIKQRSILISGKTGGANVNQQLDFWDEKYANHSTYITNSRSRLIHKINEHIGNIYDDIISHLQSRNTILKDLKVIFETTPDTVNNEAIINALKENRPKELILGWTNIGAKGDDFTLDLGGNAVKGNSSYGEQWSIMIAFTLSIWQILKDVDSSFTNFEPILLLDDVFTGLDESRRKELARQIKKITQCIITCADEKDLPNFKYNRIDFKHN